MRQLFVILCFLSFLTLGNDSDTNSVQTFSKSCANKKNVKLLGPHEYPLPAKTSMRLFSESKVFSPRPGSYAENYGKSLMKAALSKIVTKPGKILVLGSGNGYESIAMAKIAGVESTGSDILPEAVYVAERNALLNGVEEKTRFVVSDLFEKTPGKFDYILFNCPRPITRELLRRTMNSEQVETAMKKVEEDPNRFDVGANLLKRFLNDLPIHMNKDSRVYLMSDEGMDLFLPVSLVSRPITEPKFWNPESPINGKFAIHEIRLAN